jgi:orotidine-5'-phosphate decarboxylase
MPKLFEDLNFDSVTVAPYMGKIQWNLAFEEHTIMLALTSNEGAFDFQTLSVDGKELYKHWKHLKPGRIQRI